MKRLDRRQWKALLILSIVVPVGFLVAFKLTGILEGPATIAETKTLEVARWEIDPMIGIFNIRGLIESPYNDDEVFAVQKVHIHDYNDDWIGIGVATLTIGINITVGIEDGFVEEVCIGFSENYENSTVRVVREMIKTENLVLADCCDWSEANP